LIRCHLTSQQFKTDYYPGENVTATIDGYRANALIREKSKVGSRIKDGVLIPGYVRYRIELRSTRKGALAREQYVDSEIINRDRNYFNKALIRAFIKNSCSREAWTGAPWLVKERYAKKFRIDMTIPDHLRQKEKVKVVEEKIDRRFKKRVRELLHCADD
jgi:hypothetical protein